VAGQTGAWLSGMGLCTRGSASDQSKIEANRGRWIEFNPEHLPSQGPPTPVNPPTRTAIRTAA
jgi:hypothetical protein